MEIGGLNANQIVSDLMSLERRPLAVLEQRQTAAEVASRALGGIRSNVEAVRLAATKLAGSDAFSRFTTTSSNSSVTASATSTAGAGSLTFSVSRLASSHGLRSVGTASSTTSVITSASTVSIARGDAAALGISMVRSTAGLAAGDNDLTVTQASSAATKRSDSALTTQTFGTGLFGNSPENISVEIDGVATSIQFTAGSYTAQQIADRIDQALTAAGRDASAGLDADGHLVVTTGGEGSANSIRFTSGPLAKLEMTTDATAITGSDAIIEVNGTTTTLTDIVAGTSVAVATGSGDLELDLSGGLRVGSLDVTTVGVGGGTLGEVASAINASGAGVGGTAIRTGDDAWRLQLTSRTTGDDGRILVDDTVFAGIGGLIESSEARNAEIVIGEGAGSYTVESSSNTFSDMMVGTSITVTAVTTEPVTIGVARDDKAVSAEVDKLVSAMNTTLAEIKVQTRYGVEGAGNGALAGNGTVRRLADQLRASLSRPVDGVAGFIGADVGIETTRDGSFTFDSAKFEAAIAADPEKVARFFGRDATTPAGVTFGDATAETQSGSYVVDVSVTATQATSNRLFDGGATTSGRLAVRIGDVTAEVNVTAGQSAAQIIASINESMAQRGFDMVAEADAGGLVLRSNDWGTGGSFEVNLDVTGAGTWDSVDGVDVAGTIDGVVATGIGRTLSLNPLVDSPAAGLSVEIDGSAFVGPGTVEYQPGLGARVTEITTGLLADDGTLDSAKSAQQRRIEDFNNQIDRFEDRLVIREASLRRQWSSLQTLLEGLQQRGNWLASQIASLPQPG